MLIIIEENIGNNKSVTEQKDFDVLNDVEQEIVIELLTSIIKGKNAHKGKEN